MDARSSVATRLNANSLDRRHTSHFEFGPMDDDVRSFGETLGRRVLGGDWPGVRPLLAPWIQGSMSDDDIRAFFEDEYRRTLEANGATASETPQFPEPDIGGNSFMTATELRKPISWAGGKVRPLASDVTDANVRYWMCLKFSCSDEQMERLGFDTFAETWIAVVSTDDGLRVGYWSQGAY
jgi:hypothetical protein